MRGKIIYKLEIERNILRKIKDQYEKLTAIAVSTVMKGWEIFLDLKRGRMLAVATSIHRNVRTPNQSN